jgi:type I restriction enzyme R subunit
MPNQNQFNEYKTRKNPIDPALIKAGWNLTDRREIASKVPLEGYDVTPGNGITDYCLYRDNGDVLAVIEGKKARRDPRVGKELLHQYLTKIEQKQPFRLYGFMTNSVNTLFGIPPTIFIEWQ